MKKVLFAFVLVLALFILQGCGGPSLVGTWTGEMTQRGMTVNVKQTFAADGKSTTEITAPLAPQSPPLVITMTGTYKLEKEVLTTTGGTTDVQGIPEAFKMMEAQIKQEAEKMSGQTSSGTVKWVDQDTVELTSAEGTLTLKRQK